MITQQVVTYIKEQLSRGIARDKIRANLVSAGWQANDVDEAFSFAEPNKPNAAVTIAPAFAVPSEIREEKPIDKTTLAGDINPVMPILKRDSAQVDNIANNPFLNPDQKVNVMPGMNAGVTPNVLPNNPVSASVSNPVSSPVSEPVSPMQSTPFVNPVSQGGINTRPPVRRRSSPMLKFIAFILFVVLIGGNAYLWLGFSNTGNDQTPSDILTNQDDLQSARNINPVDNQTQFQNDISVVSPAEELLLPATSLQNSASAYFSKNNTYGGVVMALGSCNAAGTVFSDTSVKESLEMLSNITGRVAQCALFGDTTANQTRTTGYIVYIPMEDAGYCIDSSGATLIVPTSPIGTSCTTGF